MTVLLIAALLASGQEAVTTPAPTPGLCRLTGIKVEMLADSETLARERYRTAEEERIGQARHGKLKATAAVLNRRFGTVQPSHAELQLSDGLDNEALLRLADACLRWRR
jgi:hypothetical protein